MDVDSYYDDIWQQDQQASVFGLPDDTTPTYDPADGLPDPAPFIGPSSGMADGEQGYAQLYVDTLDDEGVRQMLDALLPLVSEQAAMPTPALGTNAAASLQHDDATVDPQVLHTDKQPTSMDAAPTTEDDEPPSPLTESTPGLSFDATSFAASPLPGTPVEVAAEQAVSLPPSDDSTQARAEESTQAANKTVKRSAKRARTPDSDQEPSTKQNKKRKTKRGRGDGAAAQTRETLTGNDLRDAIAMADTSASIQGSTSSTKNDDDARADVDTGSTARLEENVRKKGRKSGKKSAGAGPGANAQSKNKAKSRPARAIENYAKDVERKKAALRIALGILNQPAGTALPTARASEMTDEVAQAIRDLIDAQPNVPRSGNGEWVECDACKKDYGILECVEKGQESDHKHDCHGVTACVICGCPVVRGDIVQWRKHRKSKCPPWRAMVKCGRHVEWLESNGLLDAGSKIYHRQFFDHDLRKEADAEADDAARRKLLLDALKAKELAKLPAAVHSSEPFKGIVSKKILIDLHREMEGEFSAA